MDMAKNITNTNECKTNFEDKKNIWLSKLRIKYTMYKINRQIRKKGYATLSLKELEKIDSNIKFLLPVPAHTPTDEFKTPLTHFHNSGSLDTIIKNANKNELEVTYWWAHNSGLYEIIGISFFGKE